MARSFIDSAKITSRRYDLFSKIPFLIAALGGFAGIWILKSYSVNQTFVTVLACSSIVAYCYVVFTVPSFRLREDQLGDNAYYLGFLYTLASLSFALSSFSANFSVDSIVANFGFALWTTIVGVALRVFINQLRSDPIEIEREARLELADAVVRMRNEIDDAVLALRSFYNIAQQTAEEHIIKSANKSADVLDASINKIGETSSQAIKNIEKSFIGFEQVSQSIAESSQDVSKSLMGLSDKIQKIQSPDDLIIRRVEPALSTIDKFSSRLNERLDADEKLIGGYLSKINEIEDSTRIADTKWRSLSKKLLSDSESVSQIIQSLDNAITLASSSSRSGIFRLKRGPSAEQMQDLQRDLSIASDHAADIKKTLLAAADGERNVISMGLVSQVGSTEEASSGSEDVSRGVV